MAANCCRSDYLCDAWYHHPIYDKYWQDNNMVRDWFRQIKKIHSSVSEQYAKNHCSVRPVKERCVHAHCHHCHHFHEHGINAPHEFAVSPCNHGSLNQRKCTRRFHEPVKQYHRQNFYEQEISETDDFAISSCDHVWSDQKKAAGTFLEPEANVAAYENVVEFFDPKRSNCRKSHSKKKSSKVLIPRSNVRDMTTNLQDQKHRYPCPGKPELSDSNKLSSNLDEGGSSNEELVLDESYINFVRLSRKYREERDAKKESDIEYIDYAKLSVDEKLEFSTPGYGLFFNKKHKEELYGSDAECIMAVETAMIRDFKLYQNENCVSAWPCIPLKFHFPVNSE